MTEPNTSTQFDHIEQLSLLNETIAITANELRRLRLRRRELPLAKFQGERNKYTAQDWLESVKSGRINFPQIVKQHFKKNFPEYKAVRGLSLAFSKPLTTSAALILRHEKTDNYFVTRTFHLRIGIIFKDKEAGDIIHFQDISSCLDQDEQYGMRWEYNSAAELEALLQETCNTLSIVVPVFENTAKRLLNNWPLQREAMPKNGDLSFSESCDAAESYLRSTSGNYSHILDAYIGRPHLTHSHKTLAAEIHARSVEGRLSPGESWIIQFADIETAKTIRVCIPYAGHMRFMQRHSVPIIIVNFQQRGGNLVTDRIAKTNLDSLIMCDLDEQKLAPVIDSLAATFADSPAILAAADAAGGAEYKMLNSNTKCHMTFEDRLFSEPRPAKWEVSYYAFGEPRPKPLKIELTAAHPITILAIRGQQQAAAS